MARAVGNGLLPRRRGCLPGMVGFLSLPDSRHRLSEIRDHRPLWAMLRSFASPLRFGDAVGAVTIPVGCWHRALRLLG